ncbi:MAG: hypothetical protein CL910_05575 [Deltaproteobacteria bacterium]|jgi:hypothetical protein|nr:hypothetical protein [Deltaproteobacteria bacterium]
MAFRPALLALCLATAWLGGCGDEVEISPVASTDGVAVSEAQPRAEVRVGASREVQDLVADIDEMLVVPQDEYPDGNAYSYAFEQLFDAVVKQRRTLRTNQVSQNMGYFIATGHGIGWDPQEEDVESLARDWREFRPDVLAGP